MKKNRTIPFGYCMQGGEIQPDLAEAKYVREIFTAYQNGSSFKEIADSMTERNVPYRENMVVWNRNIIKRMLENDRYIGERGYPTLIEREVFMQANQLKSEKTAVRTSASEAIASVKEYVFCAECGEPLKRMVCKNHKERWECRNPVCIEYGFRLTDEMIEQAVRSAFDMAIENPDILQSKENTGTYQPSLEVTRQQNEVNRLLDCGSADSNNIMQEVFKLAQLKFLCCVFDDHAQKTAVIHTKLLEYKELNTPDTGLLRSVISQIRISRFYMFEIELINGAAIKIDMERTNKKYA